LPLFLSDDLDEVAARVVEHGNGCRSEVGWSLGELDAACGAARTRSGHPASVLLSKGVSPALVAKRLGHDLKTLLCTYAHVIRQDEDRVRAIVDVALGGDAEGCCGLRWSDGHDRRHGEGLGRRSTAPPPRSHRPPHPLGPRVLRRCFEQVERGRTLVSGYAYERMFAVASGRVCQR
jgi:hypothetical protein